MIRMILLTVLIAISSALSPGGFAWADENPAPAVAWWTLPQGSPEREAARQAAQQRAHEARQRARAAGVPEPRPIGPSGPFIGGGPSPTARGAAQCVWWAP